MKGRFDKRVLKEVDVEIRDIIEDLNNLPFVLTTIFSCAGYGVAGLGPRHPNNFSEDDSTGHKRDKKGLFNGYVLIAYKSESDWKKFHEQMVDIVDNSRILSVNKFWQKRLGNPVRIYILFGRIEQEISRKWNKVRQVIKQYE